MSRRSCRFTSTRSRKRVAARPRTTEETRDAANRAREESAGVQPQGSTWGDAPVERLRRAGAGAVFLSEGRYAWLYEGGVCVSRFAPEPEDEQGGSARREHSRRGEQGAIRGKVRSELPATRGR